VTAAGLAAACAWTGYLSRKTGAGNAMQLACADLLFSGFLAVELCAPSGIPSRPFRSALRYFGRISYCIYLVHLFAFWGFDRVAGVHPPMSLAPIAVRAVIVLAVSTAVAELSWRYLEAPLLGVGSFLQFVRQPTPVSAKDPRLPKSI
jgi:peptidoglycan/LPS O-acetylase OafA/YrhL